MEREREARRSTDYTRWRQRTLRPSPLHRRPVSMANDELQQPIARAICSSLQQSHYGVSAARFSARPAAGTGRVISLIVTSSVSPRTPSCRPARYKHDHKTVADRDQTELTPGEREKNNDADKTAASRWHLHYTYTATERWWNNRCRGGCRENKRQEPDVQRVCRTSSAV